MLPKSIARLSVAGVCAAFALSQSALAETEPDIIRTHGYSTFGDLKYPADFPYFDFVNPDAPKGGTMSFAAEGTFDSMNAYSTLRGTPGRLSTIMYESILTSSLDEVSAAYCLLCTFMEYPETKDWVIFHLRPEARFSDGTPLTAHDILFSHEMLLEQGTPSFASFVTQVIESAEALDDHTLKFTFTKGIPRKNLIPLVGGTPAWSKAWFEETGARLDESRLQVSPGSGPYMLERATPGREILYRRNPDYWGADLPVMRGRANFDRIRVVYYADSNAAFIGFTSGDYMFRIENSSINWATAYDFPAVERGHVIRAELPDGTLPGASGFVFNLRRDFLQDRNIRKALGLMYNFTFTNNTLQFGLFRQRESFWQGSDLQATGIAEGLELEYLQSVADLIAPEILTEPAFVPHSSSGATLLDRANLRQAGLMLDQAGWESRPPAPLPGRTSLGVAGLLAGIAFIGLGLGAAKASGVIRLVSGGLAVIVPAAVIFILPAERPLPDDGMRRDAEGRTLDIEFLERSATFDRILLPYIENLRQLGVNAEYRRIDPAQFQLLRQTFDYDMIVAGYNNGLEEGIGLSQRFGTDYRDDVFNPAGFGHPAVDRLIDMVVEATTRDEMEAGVRAIDRIMRHEYFMVPIWYLDRHLVAYFDIFDHPDPLPPYSLGELDIWWFDEDKAAALRAAGAIR